MNIAESNVILGKIVTHKQWVKSNALFGVAIWLLFLWFAPRGSSGLMKTIENLLLLAILVHVPLALGLIVQSHNQDDAKQPCYLIGMIQPVVALIALCSFMLPIGLYAGLLVLPWMFFTGLLGLYGLQRIWRLGVYPLHKSAINAGLLYIPIGGAWLFMSRYGMYPLNFPGVIVLLTAIHFHYTGFAVPVMTGMVGRFMDKTQASKQLYGWIAFGIIAAMPLIATGITLSPLVEIMGVSILFVSILGLAVLSVMEVARRLPHRMARWLLVVSALSAVTAISFALLYGMGEFLGQQFITLPRMVQLHGWINGVGFVLCGLVAWHLVQEAELITNSQ